MSQYTFALKCECCGKIDYEMPRTDEMAETTTAMACNYCFDCQIAGRMRDYYNEWIIEESELPVIINNNQLQLF